MTKLATMVTGTDGTSPVIRIPVFLIMIITLFKAERLSLTRLRLLFENRGVKVCQFDIMLSQALSPHHYGYNRCPLMPHPFMYNEYHVSELNSCFKKTNHFQ